MRLLFATTAFLVTTLTYGQKKINLKEAGKYIGDSVLVCGRVADVKYVDNNVLQQRATLIN